MSCYYPRDAWRTVSGKVVFREPVESAHSSRGADFQIRCGNCYGCRRDRARDWTTRNLFEWSQHDKSCWITLTYAQAPHMLVKEHLSSWVKRVRARLSDLDGSPMIRFFGCGEYGEHNARPHYHAIMYGLSRDELRHPHLQACWRYGRQQVDQLEPASIAYVSGYVAKKYTGVSVRGRPETVDPETGEVLPLQLPFLLMSRRPGIGAWMRDYPRSIRKSVQIGGRELPTPKYFLDAWKRQASDADLAARSAELEFASLDRLSGDDPLVMRQHQLTLDSAISEMQSRKRGL